MMDNAHPQNSVDGIDYEQPHEDAIGYGVFRDEANGELVLKLIGDEEGMAIDFDRADFLVFLQTLTSAAAKLGFLA